MPRPYSISFQNVAVTAVQDLLAVYCGASMAVAFEGFSIGQITKPTVELLNFSIKRMPATVTSGSGGASVTPRKMGRGNAAATATARRNDTTQAITGGTAEILHAGTFNIVNGAEFYWPDKIKPDFGLSEALVLSLDTIPAASMNMSGTLYFTELF